MASSSDSSKTVRFKALVAQSGPPEPIVLWVAPEKDAHFQHLLQQKRVLSVHQQHGAKKDYGEVGFIREPGVNYFVFPKTLRAFEGRRVIGIDYSLVHIPAATAPSRKLTGRPPIRKQPKPPVVPKYRVTVVSTATREDFYEIEAPTSKLAEQEALQRAATDAADFSHGEVHRVVKETHKI